MTYLIEYSPKEMLNTRTSHKQSNEILQNKKVANYATNKQMQANLNQRYANLHHLSIGYGHFVISRAKNERDFVNEVNIL